MCVLFVLHFGGGGGVSLHVLDFCIGGGGGKMTPKLFFGMGWGVGVFGCLIFFLCVCVCVCVGILFFGVKHSLIHSHNFFRVFGGSVSVRWCAFLFLGNNKQLNNCFWKIRVALKRLV